MTQKPVDELTKLGIRVTTVDTRVDMALDKCKQTRFAVEDLIAAQNEQIKVLEKKLTILAKAVHAMAKSQGKIGKRPTNNIN